MNQREYGKRQEQLIDEQRNVINAFNECDYWLMTLLRQTDPDPETRPIWQSLSSYYRDVTDICYRAQQQMFDGSVHDSQRGKLNEFN